MNNYKHLTIHGTYGTRKERKCRLYAGILIAFYRFSAIPGGMLHSTRTSMETHIRVRQS